MIEGKSCFITGGAGFIGSHLCERLVESNTVTVYGTGSRNALKQTPLLDHPNLTFIEGDVLDADGVKRSIDGAQIVIHCAAIAGTDTVGKSILKTMDVNLFGTRNVLDEAVAADVERFIDFSTSEVYGPHVYKDSEDSLTAQGPVGELRWVYSVSKLAAEHLCYCYREEYGLDTVTVRPFNIYGPRQVGEGAIHRFVVQALKGEPITVAGDGTQIRAWCYVDDFVDGVMAALETPEAVGETFNLGNPQGTVTVLNLATKIVRLSGSPSSIEFIDQPAAEVHVRVPAIDKAQRLLGYRPKIDIEEGLKRTIESYRENPVA